MKKQLWVAAGIAGMLLGNAPADAWADVNVNIGVYGNRSPVAIETWPSFLYVPQLGFSVGMNSPRNIVMYDNDYYVYRNNNWYRSSSKRGPWTFVRRDRVPRQIRRHNWADIRRYRDAEYRRHGDNRTFSQNARFENNRRDNDNRDFEGGNRR